ncbi:MAG: hypothetical protein ACYDAO_09100 [Thermoplasmataceae archaeon]
MKVNNAPLWGTSSSSGPFFNQPGTTYKGITGTEYIWTVTFSNSEYQGLSTNQQTITFTELIGLENGNPAVYGKAEVSGSYVIHWGSILNTIINFGMSGAE